ncbi:MAG: hypothetical protein QG603_234 [Patescibacteria group bacterium]|nr:hypothetical protein [Patescibacteria group bacterium]MDQ5970457.1 hypothetical protein [Patescibacteria group bacterium]
MEPFYRKIFAQSWQIIKQNFHLLFFGLFASLLGFNEMKMAFNFQNVSPDFLGSWVITWWNSIQKLASQNDINWSMADSYITLIGLFIIYAIILILAISSQGALIHSAAKYLKSTKGKVNNSLSVALEKFWPLLGINLINTIIGYFFIVFVISPMIGLVAMNSGLSFYFLLSLIIFFLLIPLIVMISFATRFGMAYIVIYNQSLWQAFNNGWELFRANWIITIESAITILLFSIVYIVVGMASIAFIFTPFIVLALLMQISPIVFYILIIIGSFAAIAVFLLITSFYGAFYNLLWANIFLRLNGKAPSHSKVHRIAHSHLPALTR